MHWIILFEVIPVDCEVETTQELP